MTRNVDRLCRGDALLGTRYRAVGLLGVGASSEVYEARGPDGELCAVKVLRSMYEGPCEAAFRLAQEGAALAALDHPNIVKVTAAGATFDGRPYFVMERLVGETLRQRLDREGKLAPLRACELALGVLDALDAAHRAGIVHRDVKPSNIFLHRPGGRAVDERPVLLDFGIAKLEGAGACPTTGGHVLGTPRYLAPEQILAGRVDARTDVYSVGLVLFEAIAGRSPYGPTDALNALNATESMYAHLTAKPHPIRRFARVSSGLERVLARALRKEPDRRWPSAGAFAVALERAKEAAARATACRLLWSRAQ
jgi:eukaryotic-like serine/threonine-protein kinase